MTIEEAIKTAIVYEKKVHATYAAAAKRAEDETAKKVFLTLAEEGAGENLIKGTGSPNNQEG